jgi:hypothetical protein
MKKKSSLLSLLSYNKKARFINSYPITFNIRRYLSVSNPIKYSRYFIRRDENMVNVFETGYDEIKSNVKLTTRRLK